MRRAPSAARPSSALARRWILMGALPALFAAGALLFGESASPPRGLAGLALLASPFVEVALARRLHPARRRSAVLIGLLAQLAGLALLEASATAQWGAATCQALARARAPGAAALGGLLALGLAVVVLRATVTPLALLAPFAVSLGVLPGLLRLGSDAVRARALRARAPGAETAVVAPPRLRPVLLAWPALWVVLVVSGRLTHLAGGGPTSGGAREADAEELSSGSWSESEGSVTRWNERMSFGEGVGRLSDEVVLWAVPDRRTRGALYLAVLALDEFDERGLGQPRLDGLREVSDGDDGRLDGWVRFAGDASTGGMRLQIAQRPLRVGRLGGDALVRLEPLRGISLGRVLYERDTALVLPGESEGFIEYTLEADPPEAQAPLPPQARAVHPDARYVQLPPPSPALERLRAYAQALIGDVQGDPARVAQLLAHFERAFSYSLEGGGFVGVEGVTAFLDERSGYCTSFAATAVLLLRSQGLACRAVGGYLADEWDEESGAHAVRGRDAHAWIEVHFAGHGWRTFDPTPTRQRERAFERRDGLLPPELGEWSSGLASALQLAAKGGADGPGLARLGAQLAQAPQVLRQELIELEPAGRVGLVALALVCVVLWFVARREASPTPAGAPPPSRWRPRRRGVYARLLEVLERRGFRPAPAESLRAFARRVEAAGVLAGFAQATETHLAERFGGLPPDDEEREAAKALLARARRPVSAGVSAGA